LLYVAEKQFQLSVFRIFQCEYFVQNYTKLVYNNKSGKIHINNQMLIFPLNE